MITGFRGLWAISQAFAVCGIRVGVGNSRDEIALSTRLRNLNQDPNSLSLIVSEIPAFILLFFKVCGRRFFKVCGREISAFIFTVFEVCGRFDISAFILTIFEVCGR